MPKGAKGKSSASSATRKKAAAKAASRRGGEDGAAPQPPAQRGQKGDKKKKGKEPKKKIFIPPPKPPAPPPDPLDDMGLAALLPAGLVVLLRRASKKDVITRTRACQALLAWVQGDDQGEEAQHIDDEARREAEVMWLPCWAHLFPRLSISPTRRLRSLSASIHTALLTTTHTRAELLSTPAYVAATLGPLAVLAFDTDRGVARVAKAALERSVTWSSGSASEERVQVTQDLAPLLTHVKLLLLSPSPAAALHASAPALAAGSGTSTPSGAVAAANGSASTNEATTAAHRDAKNRDDTNVEEDIRATDGRLAAGAAGALAWVIASHPTPLPLEEFSELLSSPMLWALLTPPPEPVVPTSAPSTPSRLRRKRVETPPSSALSIGAEAPLARARAWTLVSALVASPSHDALSCALPTLAPVALSAAWNERDAACCRAMWDALLPLLRKEPRTWSMAAEEMEGHEQEEDESVDLPAGDVTSAFITAASAEEADEVEAASDSEDEVEAASDSDSADEEEEEENQLPPVLPPLKGDRLPPALAGLERWLRSACCGLPSLSYPAVLVVLSTIPATLLPPLSGATSLLLDAHWAGLEARAGADPLALRAFVASFAECAGFLAQRIARGGEGEQCLRDATEIGDRQLARLWDAFVLDRPEAAGVEAEKVPARAKAALEPSQPIASAARRLASLGRDAEAVELFLERIRTSLHSFAEASTLDATQHSTSLQRAVRTLAAIGASSGAPTGLRERVRALVLDVSGTLANVLCADAEEASLPSIVALLAALQQSFPEFHSEAEQGLADVLRRAATDVLPGAMKKGLIPAHVAAAFYGAYLPLVKEASERASVWNSALESVSDKQGLDAQALQALFDAADGLPDAVLAVAGSQPTKLDEDVLTLAQRVFQEQKLKAAERAVLARLLDRPLPFVTQGTADGLLQHLVAALAAQARAPTPQAPYLLALLEAWCTTRERARRLTSDPKLAEAPASVFSLAHLDPQPEYATAATRLWTSLIEEEGASEAAATLLRQRAVDPNTPLRAVIRAGETLPRDAAGLALLPTPQELEQHLRTTCAQPLRSALAVLDPLVPLSGASGEAVTAATTTYDSTGLTPYARSLVLLTHFLEHDRPLARSAPWTLPHLVMFAIAAEDASRLRGASPALFAPNCGLQQHTLAAYAVGAVNAATSSLASLAAELTDQWHAASADALRKGTATADTLGSALQCAYQADSAQGARVFARLLAGILSFSAAGETAGVAWLRAGLAVQDTKPEVAAAILAVTRSLVLASPVYERGRNELAARLAGVPPSKAEAQGLPLLRLLLAAAPPPDAPVALVPQQRAIFLLQALQRWFADDDAELSEEMHVRLSQVLVELLPIVESIPGSHLELICDVAEAQLDAASWQEADLPCTAAALALMETLQLRAQRAEALRDVWKERAGAVQALLRPLFLSLPVAPDAYNQPFAHAAGLAATLARSLPDGTFSGEEDETALLRLLAAPHRHVQLAAYRTLASCIRARVSTLVVETAIDATATLTAATLSSALLDVVSNAPPAQYEDDVEVEDGERLHAHAVLAFFLAWLALLEHFEEASLSLKSAFSAQVERVGALDQALLPTCYALMLRLEGGRPWDPRGWAMDEVFLDEIEPAAHGALQLLAGHLYFRSLTHLPVGVRTHVQSLRDRGLSTQISTLTTRHFSPVLADAELAHLRGGSALAALEGEGLAVRITTANEVIATYTVDEHPMQIAVSIPSDFPLHGVEVRDVKRVGVSEAQWRSWLLATQNLLTGKNGLIVDAITLFKRNAEAAFAGYEDAECAICYSIVGGNNGTSLPTRKCKTCHKGFHPECLLRWTLSSGGANCPMCRSLL